MKALFRSIGRHLACPGRPRGWRRMLATFGVGLSCAAMAASPVEPTADPERGRQLYETGSDTEGRRLQAVGRAGGRSEGAATACVNCHRPSTLGGIEGGLLVPPIRGDLLFAPGRPPSTQLNMQWMRHQTRSAYDQPRLQRALTRGVDPDGRTLGTEMPRYRLSTQDVRDLAAYLDQRGRQPVPGLVRGTLHVATVVTPDAPPARRETVLKVMRAWSEGLQLGPVPVVWHPWVLQGPPESWAAQLEAHARQTPVFALVSGAGAARWEAVEAFCEGQRIACVLPSIDRVPGGRSTPRYSTYFSAGVDGEARMLAQVLVRSDRVGGEVQQIGQGEAAQAAMATLAPPLRTAGLRVFDTAWSGPYTPRRTGVRALMLWLGAPEVSAWLQAQRPEPGQTVYLSAQLAPMTSVAVPPAWRAQVRWVSMRATPTEFYGALARSLEPWARRAAAQGEVAPIEFGEARAAGFLFGDAAGLTQGQLQPEYLIERLEVAVRQRVAASIYIQASLGPGQRIAAKGGHLMGFRAGQGDHLAQLSPYLRALP